MILKEKTSSSPVLLQGTSYDSLGAQGLLGTRRNSALLRLQGALDGAELVVETDPLVLTASGPVARGDPYAPVGIRGHWGGS